MDNILDKFGLYEFFSALLPGMFFIVVLVFIDFPLLNKLAYPNSEAFQVVSFVLFSYIIGTIMQEIGSSIDKKINLRKKSIRKILSDKDFSKVERNEVKEVVKDLYKKQNTDDVTEYDCENAFFKCKAYLESKEKIDKENKLDSIYAMSRDLIVCNGVLVLFNFWSMLFGKANIKENIICILMLSVLSFIYYKRLKRYSSMRVRSIFRKYIALKKMDKI